MELVVAIFTWLVYACMIAIFVRAITSWFPIDRSGEFIRTLNRFTDPLIAPWRRLIPTVGMFDLSTMAVMIIFILMLRTLERMPGQ